MHRPTPEFDGRVLTAVFVSVTVLTVLATSGGTASAAPDGDPDPDENATSCEEVWMHVPAVVETTAGGTEQVMVLTAHCADIDNPAGPVDTPDASGQSADSVAVQRARQSTAVHSADEQEEAVAQQPSQCTRASAHQALQRERRVVRADGGDTERYERQQQSTQTGETCRAELGASHDGTDGSVSASNADDVDADDAGVTGDVTVDEDTADVVENESAVADEANAVADTEDE
jgi:hypothetical protein